MLNRANYNSSIFAFYTAKTMRLALFSYLSAVAIVLFGLFVSSSHQPPYLKENIPAIPMSGMITENFLNALRVAGIYPNAVRTVVRTSLSVKGEIVTFNNDSVETFEYLTSQSASEDSAKLTALYSGPRGNNGWSKLVNLYQKDALLVFYLGRNKDVLAALNATMGKPIVTAI